MYRKQFNTYYTVRGLYRNFTEMFDGLYLKPITLQLIDKDILIDNIIDRFGAMEIAYTDPYELQEVIGYWSRSRAESWERIADALTQKYNPIHNYDRREEILHENENEVERTNDKTVSYTGTVKTETDNTTTDNGKHNETEDKTNTTSGKEEKKGRYDETTTHETSAYNDGLAFTNRDVKNGTNAESSDSSGNEKTYGTITGTDSNTNILDGQETVTHDRTDRERGSGSEKGNETHKELNYLYGNIGVTTTQQMIESSIDLYKTDLYNIICEEFKEKFCIMLYIY